MQYFIVDAFTESKFGGNPAGVVIYEELDPMFMQKFAAEVKFSETAFIKILSDSLFEIRFFTPTDEVDLCGHATIASFQAMLDAGIVQDQNVYQMKTLAGILPVTIKDHSIMMEQAKPKMGNLFENRPTLAKLFRMDPAAIGDDHHDLIPQSVSTGLWDIMLPVRSAKTLSAMNPDFQSIAAYSRENGVGGIHAFTLDSKDDIAICRNFGPLLGIDEEAATGTSNGALTYYLYDNKVISQFGQPYTFLQGQWMGRPSRIITSIIQEEDPRILVGGRAVVLTRGELL